REPIYNDTSAVCLKWVPAFAGMTVVARNDDSDSIQTTFIFLQQHLSNERDVNEHKYAAYS
ncbi:MAG: hypothetical protein WAW86_03150, partial [Gammaproteobacteria bacterium]